MKENLSYAANGVGAPATNRIANTGFGFDNAGNQTSGDGFTGSLGITVESATKPLPCAVKLLKTLKGILKLRSFTRRFPKTQKSGSICPKQ